VGWIQPSQRHCRPVQPLLPFAEGHGQGAFQTRGQVIHPQQEAIKGVGHGFQAMPGEQQTLLDPFKLMAQGAPHPCLLLSNPGSKRLAVRGQQFRSPARSRGAQVGSEIRNGEIDFMADGADHRQGGVADGPGQVFIVEGQEVFGGTATSAQDDQVGCRAGVDCLQGLDHASRRLFSLHNRRIDRDPDRREASGGNADEIVDCRSLGRGDQGDVGGKGGQGAFQVFIKQPFGRKSLFQLGKGQLQGTGALHVHSVDNKLIVAPRFVHGDPAAADHMVSVLGHLGQIALLHLEQHRLDLGVGVFEGKIAMAGIGFVQVGNLSGDADKGESSFEQVADGAVEFGDGESAAVIHGALVNGSGRKGGRPGRAAVGSSFFALVPWIA